jgi:hypothetical protein
MRKIAVRLGWKHSTVVTLLAMAAHRFFHTGLPYQNWIEPALALPAREQGGQ